MKISYLIICIVFLIGFIFPAGLFGQASADSVVQPNTLQEKKVQELPEIQLQDYTIVGLATVSLPHKIRQQIFKQLEISWENNDRLYLKEPPEVAFQFAGMKPSIFTLNEFPWLDASFHYGSFNTAGLNIGTQFKTPQIRPHLLAGFQRSDGHLSNAQWTEAGLMAGIHQKLSDNHSLSIGTDYKFQTRGIWGNYEKFQKDWETETVLWQINGNFDQQWHQNFRSSINGIFFLDDHRNAFDFEDRGFDAHADLLWTIGSTDLGGKARYQTIDLTIKSGNLTIQPPDSSLLRAYQSSLSGGSFFVRQNFDFFQMRLGGLYQRIEEETHRTARKKIEEDRWYPEVSVSLNFSGKASLYARFRPSSETHRYRHSIRLNPFSDLNELHIVDYSRRIEAGLNLNPARNFKFNLRVSSSKAEQFPALVVPTDSLGVEFHAGGYPGWVSGTIPEIQIQELKAHMDWYLLTDLRWIGWFTYIFTEIRKSGSLGLSAIGKEVPYTPNFSGMSKLVWNFYGDHQMSVALHYTGERFDDGANNFALSDFLLFDAELRIFATENIRIFITGQNLLDTRYQRWKGFPEPGISGHAGIQLVL